MSGGCEHMRTRCIHGDEILARMKVHLRWWKPDVIHRQACLDCGKALDRGPICARIDACRWEGPWASDVNSVSGEGGLIEVLAAHGQSEQSLALRNGFLGVRCKCGHFMPTEDWRDGVALIAEHQAAAVREWLAGVLDGVEADARRERDGFNAAYDVWPSDLPIDLSARHVADLRDRLGITGGGQ